MLANFFGNVDRQDGIHVSVESLDGAAFAGIVVGGSAAGSHVTAYADKDFHVGAPAILGFDISPA